MAHGDLANPAPVYSGAASIKVTARAWEAFRLHATVPIMTAPYSGLAFWIHGGPTGGQPLAIQATVNGNAQAAVDLGTAPANTWKQYTLSLATLGLAGQASFDGFWIMNNSAGDLSPYYIDDITLVTVAQPGIAHLTVDANTVVRTTDPRWFGVNAVVWDANLAAPETVSLLTEMGCRFMRYPGGAQSDDYHWNVTPADTTTFAAVVGGAGAQAVLTANYGSGAPEEAAAWVRFCNVNNHFGFKYWEIGNENYGSWETDNTPRPHDPYTYALRFKDFAQQMKAVDPTIKVGVPVVTGEDSWANYLDHPAINALTGQAHNGWTPVLLATLKSLGVTPDFLDYHLYPEDTEPGQPSPDNDATLLQAAGSWPNDAADLRQQVTAYFGVGGQNIELLCMENNSDLGLQGKQSTSLVNGLYYADSLGQLMLTEFNAFMWWNLRNGVDNRGSFAPTLYGWRNYGDFGMINGLNTRHPTFYAAKLVRSFANPGDADHRVSSDNSLIAAYAARHSDGKLALLVINKDFHNSLTGQIALNGFAPQAAATVASYGIPQDNAARDNGPAQAQDIATTTFNGAAANFDYIFPPLSLTVLTLTPTGGQQGPALSMSPVLMPMGLRIMSGPAIYDRENIATDTSANDYGWVGATTPVTYSLSISDFPAQAYRGFQAHVFLVPNASTSAAPDYDDASIAMLDIETHVDGSATAWFRYKINRPGENAFLYGAGTLGQVNCPTGPLGTWSVSFTSNSALTLTAPNGTTTLLNFPDPASIQPVFGNKVTAYFGNKANDLSLVGQSTTFGRIRISGTPRAQAIDETFPGQDLNLHPGPVGWQWIKRAAAPANISVAAVDGFGLSWPLPDTGFVLQFSPSLTPAAWTDLNPINNVVQGNARLVQLARSSLPNSGVGYFRLIQRP